jgi:hypothetical protein
MPTMNSLPESEPFLLLSGAANFSAAADTSCLVAAKYAVYSVMDNSPLVNIVLGARSVHAIVRLG